MQTLWTRAVQKTCSCRCPQCLRSVRAVGRRANTGTSRQTPRVFPSSTFVYSTLVAAAVTVEGARKNNRREQWDAAIANAKKDLESSDKGAAEGEAEDSEETLAGFLSRSEIDADPFSVLDPDVPQPWPENTGPPLVRHRLPPQSVYTEALRKEIARGSRYSPKKLETIRCSMDILQLQIWLKMPMQVSRDAAVAAVPNAYADMFADKKKLRTMLQLKQEELGRLRSSSPDLSNFVPTADITPLSSYSQDDFGSHHRSCTQLNGALQKLLRLRRDGDTLTSKATKDLTRYQQGHVLARLAYNLHASPGPPNIETYNSLLVGFSDIPSFRRLIPYVVESLRETKVRPNEITLEYVLRYYTIAKDAEGFVTFVDLLRGKNGGLMLARPDMAAINDTASTRLIRKEGAEHKIIQLPYPTPSVFTAILQGVLQFSGFEAGKQLCQVMRTLDWGVGMHSLRLLLQKAADHKEWQTGAAFYRELKAQRQQSVMKYGIKNAESIGVDGYTSMLRLCRDQRMDAMYNRVLADAAQEQFERKDLLKRIKWQDKWLSEQERKSSQPAKLVQTPAPTLQSQDVAESVVMRSSQQYIGEVAGRTKRREETSNATVAGPPPRQMATKDYEEARWQYRPDDSASSLALFGGSSNDGVVELRI